MNDEITPPPEDVSDADWLAMCKRALDAEEAVAAWMAKAREYLAEIERLRETLDEAKQNTEEAAAHGVHWNKRATKAEAEIERLRARIQEVIEIGGQDHMLRFETKWAATIAPMLRQAVDA